MTYQETLDWLFHQLASFQRVGKSAYNKDLGNITALCSALNQPQLQFKSIHIAGTNGKGSTSHLLASVLQEQGYKVGLYTSPHLVDFRERIRINGFMISEKEVVDFVNSEKDTFSKMGVSFFEMTTALAFSCFAKHKVDIAVIETGLGGRLDATNIVHPELAIITNVALDHQNLLGNTLQEIALEKAGIIKQNTPVVLGATTKEVVAIIRTVSKNKNAHLNTAPVTSAYTSQLKGFCQQENTATVVEAVKELRALNWPISEDALVDGLSNVLSSTNIRGRWEQLASSPKVICDTGHNIHAMTSIVAQLKKESFKNLWFVLGMLADKDVNGILALLPKQLLMFFVKQTSPEHFRQKTWLKKQPHIH